MESNGNDRIAWAREAPCYVNLGATTELPCSNFRFCSTRSKRVLPSYIGNNAPNAFDRLDVLVVAHSPPALSIFHFCLWPEFVDHCDRPYDVIVELVQLLGGNPILNTSPAASFVRL